MRRVPSSQLGAGLALLLLGLVYFYNLDAPVLWGDEADTAVVSRNVLQNGYPSTWDGRNLLAYDNCSEMGRGMVSRKLPWVQYYVGALSLFIFGETTFGARALFAVIGLCSFFPLRSVLRHHGAPGSTFASLLILLIPQIVLLQRSARYYSLLVFSFCLLLVALFGRWRSERARLATAASCLVLIIQSHYVAGLACALALPICAWLCERARLRTYCGLAALSVGLWLAWYWSISPVEPMWIPGSQLLAGRPLTWIVFFLRGVLAGILDLDFVGCLPLLGLVLALAAGRWRAAGLGAAWVRRPLVAFVLINLSLLVLVTAATFGGETHYEYGLVRYMPHLAVALPLALLLLLITVAEHWRLRREWALVGLCLMLLPNPLSISYWVRGPEGRQLRLSWWPPVYAEIFGTPRDDFAAVLALLEATPPPEGPDPLVAAMPRSLNPILVFYLGHRYRIQPSVSPGTSCAREVSRLAGGEMLERVKGEPDWVVSSARSVGLCDSQERIELPMRRGKSDGSRPELIRHDFGDPPHPGRRYFVHRCRDRELAPPSE